MTKSKIGLVLVMLSVLILMIFTSLDDSPTYDEPAHIVSGLSYIKYFDLRLNNEHPPLIKLLSGISLNLFYPDLKFKIEQQDFDSPYTHVIYDLGRELFLQNDPTKLLLIARIPSILITLFSVFLVFQLTKELTQNEFKALVASVIFGFEINVLANGSLVTTDMGLTAFWIGMVLFYLKFLHKNQSINLIISGLFFGLSLLTKYSAVFIIPIIFFASFLFSKDCGLKKIISSLISISIIWQRLSEGFNPRQQSLTVGWLYPIC